ncbi:class I SAM-dependent methyltransferase [Nocardia salmonicida]|uniref:class I SAM-dependent methyltransferase n=1 Tax=Nocardia salmonicida TaxID=53431 RepID=UPI00362A9BF1
MTHNPIEIAGYTATDFNAVYRGGDFLDGSAIAGVPWDIGRPQPAVVEFERAGLLRGAVLDIGCGLGDNAIYLATRGYQVTGIDAASAAIEQAITRAGGLDIEFDVADATTLTGYESRFDTVLDSALYHTLDAASRTAYLHAAHRVTRPGGALNMLCFADLPGGMPTPLSVSEANLSADLTATGWHVTQLQQAIYWGVAATTSAFFDKLGISPRIDAEGHTLLPVWSVQAERVS